MSGHRDLPSDHAFVVQFRARETGSALPLEGRVEHLASGQATRFDSPQQLLRFIEQTLGSHRRGRTDEGPRSDVRSPRTKTGR